MIGQIQGAWNGDPGNGNGARMVRFGDGRERGFEFEIEPELLLVEDDPSDVELTMRILTKRGLAHRVALARDGADAFDFLAGAGEFAGRGHALRPKAVILDLKLPRLGGIELLRLMKDDARLRDIPVVVLTSSSEESDMIEVYRLGANSYVVKPVDFDAYTRVVTTITEYWLGCNAPPIDSHGEP
jgi:CheY-like chemotaxis protein